MTPSVSHSDDGPTGRAGPKVVDPAAAMTQPPAPARKRHDWRDWRTWSGSAVIQGLVALAIYTTVWLTTAAKPLLHNVGDAHLLQRSMDPNFYTWCLRWWPWAIAHGQNPLFAHVIRAPAGTSLAWVTTVPPVALLGTPLTLAAGPIAAFNILTAIALPLSAWAAFVLCRRLTRQFWPSLVGGAVFGFSAYEMNHVMAGQLNLAYSLLLPILGYLVVRWREQSISVRAFVILAGLTMAVQFYLFLETFADLTAILAVALILGIVLAGREARPAVLRLTKHLAVAYGIALALALPYLVYALTMSTPNLKVTTKPDLASLVVPRAGSAAGIGWLEHLAARPRRRFLGRGLYRDSAAAGRLRARRHQLVQPDRPLPHLHAGLHRRRLPWPGAVPGRSPGRQPSLAWAVEPADLAQRLPGPADAVRLPRACGSDSDVPRQATQAHVAAVGARAAGDCAIIQDTPVLDIAPHSTVPTFISSGNYRQHLKPGEIVVVVSDIGNAGMLWQADTDFYTRLAGGYINQAMTSPHRSAEAGAEPLECDPGDRLEVRVIRQGRRDRRNTYRPQPRAIVGRHLQEDGPEGPVRRQCHRVPDQRVLDLPSPQRGAAHDPAR